jgi:hypothetical protein
VRHHTFFISCTNLLIMSTSGSDIMQEKEADTLVVWNDLEGLRTHLEGVLERSAHEGVNAHQALQL